MIEHNVLFTTVVYTCVLFTMMTYFLTWKIVVFDARISKPSEIHKLYFIILSNLQSSFVSMLFFENEQLKVSVI